MTTTDIQIQPLPESSGSSTSVGAPKVRRLIDGQPEVFREDDLDVDGPVALMAEDDIICDPTPEGGPLDSDSGASAAGDVEAEELERILNEAKGCS